MISKVVVGAFLVLILSSCSGNSSTSSEPDPSGSMGHGTDPIETESLKGLICSPSKAEAAVEKCISGMSEIDKLIELPRRLSTWGSLETNEFVDVLLDRKAFKARFRLSDREVQCLKSKMCMEQ